MDFSLAAESRDYSLAVVHWLLIAAASLVAEDKFWVPRLQELQHAGSAAAAGGLWSTSSVVAVPCVGRQIIIQWDTREVL